jgi:rubrerythrin
LAVSPARGRWYGESDSLNEIHGDIYAEHIAIESYREMLVYVQEKDLTTRRILEELLAKEEAHVRHLVSLLVRVKIAKGASFRSGPRRNSGIFDPLTRKGQGLSAPGDSPSNTNPLNLVAFNWTLLIPG